MSTPEQLHATTRRVALWAIPPVTLIIALCVGIIPRIAAREALQRQTSELAEPTVSTTHPQVAASSYSIKLPGDVQAYQETDIYSRTSGYIKHWNVDMGAKVLKGQLLATIEAPEIDAQLLQASSDDATALANYRIAKITADRWVGLFKSNAVSQQQTQEYVSTMKAKQAMLASANANVSRLQQMQSYEKVTAPFSGVITARNVDNGALIDAGSASGARAALFHLAEIDKLRVFVNVPQDQAQDVGTNTVAHLTLPQHPGRVFSGAVSRTAGAIDASSRTLRVEVDVANPDNAILSGAFTQVILVVGAKQPGLSLPLNTLLFRPDGVQIAVIDDENKIHMQTVTLGRNFGARVEILTGLTSRDRVILNPGDSVSNGQLVHVAAPDKTAA